jgi:hypothetical protein
MVGDVMFRTDGYLGSKTAVNYVESRGSELRDVESTPQGHSHSFGGWVET